GSGFGLLLLPERCAGFQIIHDEFRGGESIAAMRAGYSNKDDLVASMQLPYPVDDPAGQDLPTLLCLQNNVLQRLFGHPRVMLQIEIQHPLFILLVLIELTNKPGKGTYGSRIAGPGTQPLI